MCIERSRVSVHNKEHGLNEVESLLTNIPVDETISFLNDIFWKNRLPQIRSKTFLDYYLS